MNGKAVLCTIVKALGYVTLYVVVLAAFIAALVGFVYGTTHCEWLGLILKYCVYGFYGLWVLAFIGSIIGLVISMSKSVRKLYEGCLHDIERKKAS